MVASAALGLGQLLTMIACQTIIANGRNSARRDARFANFTLVTSTAQFAAPALGGFLVSGGGSSDTSEELQLGSVQIVAGLAGVVGLIAAISLVRRPGTLAQRPQHFGAPSPGAMAQVLRDPTVVIALIVGFCVLSAADLLVAFLPAYGQVRGLSPGMVGLLISAHGLAAIAVRLCMVRLLHRFTRRALLSACLAVAAAGLASVPFVSSASGIVRAHARQWRRNRPVSADRNRVGRGGGAARSAGYCDECADGRQPPRADVGAARGGLARGSRWHRSGVPRAGGPAAPRRDLGARPW